MDQLLLAIDVGNSAATFGYLKTSSPGRLESVHNIPTNVFRPKSKTRHPLSIKKVDGIIVSSVVPEIDATLRKTLHSASNAKIVFVTPKTRSRVKNRTTNPSEVGADRIVNARAAMEITSTPCVVVDFGTATTFDCVSPGGNYLGGVIAPGPVISAEALYLKTSKLPMVRLKKPARILGRNTLESIQSGLYHGYRGLVMEIVTQLKKKMGPRTMVLATGGQAKWILKGLPIIDRHIPFLTLTGLGYIWKDLERNNF